ncbi:MAG: hypothetical protein IT244_13420 [Bacteroidia bacterium]|nr:hypothetical protein [Bacteroidia bacterium]
MKLPVFLLLSAVFAFSACKKFKIEDDIPPCIEESAKEKTKSVSSEYATILEYEFQGNIVYVFDLEAGQNNSSADIFNTSCEKIGYLGGVDQNKEVLGEPFTNAKFIRRIWPTKT